MVLKILIILSFLSIISAFIIHQIAKRNPEKESPWKKYTTYNFLLILNIILILTGLKWYLIFGFIIIFIGFTELIRVGNEGQLTINKLMFSLSLFCLIAISFLYFLYSKPSNVILFFYFSVIIFDAFSQLSGQLFGKHKITSISPNKTYEGTFGGFFVTTLAQVFVLDFNWDNHVLLTSGIVVCIFAFLGDLLASFYKRQGGVKDFSNLLPGQGGILDRYDSWIFASVILVWL